MSAYVIRCVALAGMTVGDSDDPSGLLLKSFDADAMGGRGHADWTADPAEAMKFADAGEATALWRRQSTVMPTRPWDGKPNRPLTAYTVEIAEA